MGRVVEKMKKITAIMVAFTMVFSALSVTPKTVSAKVTMLSEKKVKITIGKSSKILVKEKKAKYSSANKKIATVSKKGLVKGKKTGKTKITVKVGKSKKTVNVTVIPANVKTCKAEKTSDTSVKVSWNKAKGAKGYYVFYKSSEKGKFTKKNTKKTSLEFKDITSGTYTFKVKAYGNSGTVSAKYSKAASVKFWKLAWSDEFNQKKLDTTVWSYGVNNGYASHANQEYTKGNNISFDDDNLIITTRAITDKETGKINFKNPITSDYITSNPNAEGIGKDVKYGKIQVKAKVAKGKGLDSAAFMIGSKIKNTPWPACGEIDIFGVNENEVNMGLCAPYVSKIFESNYKANLTQDEAANAYHVYEIIWEEGEPGKIEYFVDGTSKGVFDLSKDSKSLSDSRWVFNEPFFFNLFTRVESSAYLSTWASKKDDGDKIVYEDYFYVDYVRVYQ